MRRSHFPPIDSYDEIMARYHARIDACIEHRKLLRLRDFNFLVSLRSYHKISTLQNDWLNSIEEKLGLQKTRDRAAPRDSGWDRTRDHGRLI
jgi:hypothetical protein